MLHDADALDSLSSTSTNLWLIYTFLTGGLSFFSLLTSEKKRNVQSALSVMLIYPTFGTFYQEEGVYRMPLAVRCVV